MKKLLLIVILLALTAAALLPDGFFVSLPSGNEIFYTNIGELDRVRHTYYPGFCWFYVQLMQPEWMPDVYLNQPVGVGYVAIEGNWSPRMECLSTPNGVIGVVSSNMGNKKSANLLYLPMVTRVESVPPPPVAGGE
jgi:hypothetical protein